MTPDTSKATTTWILAIVGGLAAGASMMAFEQGLAKVVAPAIIIAGFAFASTFATGARKRLAVCAWLVGGVAAGVAGALGRYLQLTSAAKEMLGANASATELASVIDASVAHAKLPLMGIVFAVAAFVVALLPLLLGAVMRRQAPAPSAPLSA